jgi:cation-transporting P-type ATPase 13A2
VKYFAREFDYDAEDVLTEIDVEQEERHSMLSSRASETSSVLAASISELERSTEFPLITRKSTDRRSDTSATDKVHATQKSYLPDEDIVIVMSGFRIIRSRLWIYRVLSVCTLGVFYLVMRWLPRWRLRLLAEPMPLSEAPWVVVEVLSSLSFLT